MTDKEILFSLYGLKIPLDDAFYKSIEEEIARMTKFVSAEHPEICGKDYLKEIIKPIVKAVLEDIFYYRDVRVKIDFPDDEE